MARIHGQFAHLATTRAPRLLRSRARVRARSLRSAPAAAFCAGSLATGRRSAPRTLEGLGGCCCGMAVPPTAALLALLHPCTGGSILSIPVGGAARATQGGCIHPFHWVGLLVHTGRGKLLQHVLYHSARYATHTACSHLCHTHMQCPCPPCPAAPCRASRQSRARWRPSSGASPAPWRTPTWCRC